jgi:hypothetical protein
MFDTPSKYLVLAVDDIIVTGPIDYADCISAMERTGAYGFFLRLGKNTDYCYMLQTEQGIPPSIDLGKGLYAWQFEAGIGDWKYPNNTDLTMYKKDDIRERLHKVKYRAPQSLECHWAGKADYRKVGLYYEASRMVNIPLNIVNNPGNEFRNINMNLYSIDDLQEKFRQGLKIDLRPLDRIRNRSAHFPFEVTFTEREALPVR